MWESLLSESMWTPEISIVEKMFRPFVVYLFLLVGLRLAGKRELAQLNPMDLIVLLTLSNTVQNAIIGPDNSVSGGLIGGVHAVGGELLRRAILVQSSQGRSIRRRPAGRLNRGRQAGARQHAS